MTGNANRGSHFVLFFVLVCVFAGALAGFLGLLAGSLAGGFEGFMATSLGLVGLVAGGCSGILVGLLWCRAMRLRFAAGMPRPVLAGALWGVRAGLLSTLILHVALMFESDRFDWELLLVGFMFGVPSGLILGAVCGAVFARLTRAEQAAGPMPVPEDTSVSGLTPPR